MRENEVLETLSLRVDLTVYGEVPVAVHAIPREQPIQTADLRMERRPLTNLDDRTASEELIGKSTRQAIASGQVIKAQFLSAEPTGGTRVVEPRAVVRIAARKGSLTVVVSGGEALQGGRMGDWIRVRNPQSGKVISGKITGPDEVEVPL